MAKINDGSAASDPLEALRKNRQKLTVKRTFTGGDTSSRIVKVSQPGAPGSLPFNQWGNTGGVDTVNIVKQVDPQNGQGKKATGRNANFNNRDVSVKILRRPVATQVRKGAKR